MQLDSKVAKTSFGKLPLSTEASQPIYSMPLSTKAGESKKFLGELTVQENMGRGSPGPNYLYEDTIKYENVRLESLTILETPMVLLPRQKTRYTKAQV